MRNRKLAFDALLTEAMFQGGYFTAKQAAACGYGPSHLVYHVKAGNFERVGVGLYRIPTVPHADHDDYIRLALWSRDRAGVPQAVVSHDSALFFHDLGEVIPYGIHLTVPPGFRKPAPEGALRLHPGTFDKGDVRECAGFYVTSPLRSLLDSAAAWILSTEQLVKCTEDAIHRGLVMAGDVRRAAATTRYQRLAHPDLKGALA